MKKIIMGAALISMAMVGCTNEDLVKNNESQLFTLEVGKGVDSRTYLNENQLVWSENDEIYVTSADGKVNGVLRLVAGANTPNGKFQGTVNGNTGKLKNIVYPAQINGMSMANTDVNELVAPMTGIIGGQQGNTLAFNCGFVKLNVLGLENGDEIKISGNNVGATLKYDVTTNSWVPSEDGTGIVVKGAENAKDFIVPVYAEKNQESETTLSVRIGENEPANVAVNIAKGEVEKTQNLYIIGDELVNPSDEETELPEGAVYVENDDELKKAYENTNIRTIVLSAGDFILTGTFGNGEPTRGELTIMGSKSSTLRMNHSHEVLVGCTHLTIDGCKILRRNKKNWGILQFNGIKRNYTISNCYIAGSDIYEGNKTQFTQGIYINTEENCFYNIINCTFDGDFGNEGAITIQNNEVECEVNIEGCEFINRGDQTARNIYVHYNNPGIKLTYDIDDAQVTWAQGKPEAGK